MLAEKPFFGPILLQSFASQSGLPVEWRFANFILCAPCLYRAFCCWKCLAHFGTSEPTLKPRRLCIGSISNAEWTGVRVRDLARLIGLDPDRAAQRGATWLTATGLDWHRVTQQHFEASISTQKALDAKGDVIVAYAMNGKELPPDHGYPVGGDVLRLPHFSGCRLVERPLAKTKCRNGRWNFI